MSKIVVKHLFKVFGLRPKRALEHLRGGGSKREVQEKYGLAVGVHDISLEGCRRS